MTYADIVTAHVLPERQRSLFSILDTARVVAMKEKLTVYVLNAPVWCDEYATGQHVYGTRDACDILFKGEDDIDAVICGESGEVMLAKVEDIGVLLAHATGKRVALCTTEGGAI